MSEAASLKCPHADQCSVCNWIQFSDQEQKDRKIKALKEALQDAGISTPETVFFHSKGLAQIRDRVDLTYENGRYGFFQKNSREIFALTECPLMSNELFELYQKVSRIRIPIRKGSLRLRVSPDRKSGLWLDFANEDIRDLLAEKNTLQSFLDLGFVEIGQRRKKLSPDFKLKDPEFHEWTRTWSQGNPIALQSSVGSFSQSGDAANQILVTEMEKLFEKSELKSWVEFGAGSGNLTFPLAGRARHVRALEFDALALQGLQKTLETQTSFKGRILLELGDFQRKLPHSFSKEEGVLVNPPRSGLQKFLDPLFAIGVADRPRDFVYMSCYLESFTDDGKKLQALGYKIEDLTIVDQFPNSPHFEILSRWQLK
jgi:23S rRNA (uracil1939-C5)-methyltransferase